MIDSFDVIISFYCNSKVMKRKYCDSFIKLLIGLKYVDLTLHKIS